MVSVIVKDRCLLCKKKTIKNIADRILNLLNFDNMDINIFITSDKEIRIFNRKYRGIDSSTDVISFSTGDIIISSRELKSYFRENLVRLITHGVLHINGYNHSNMKKKEEYVKKYVYS